MSHTKEMQLAIKHSLACLILLQMLRAVSDGPLSTTPLLQRQTFLQQLQQQPQPQEQQASLWHEQEQDLQQDADILTRDLCCDDMKAQVPDKAASLKAVVSSNGQLLVEEWQRECLVVWKALSGDLVKVGG